jgi:hypothetical protein
MEGQAMSSKGTFDIAVINASTTLSDDQIRPAVAALQKQVTQHFAAAVVDALRRPAHYRYDMRPRIGSRRERRRTPRDRWLRSSVKVLAAVG